jgi:antitoxin FitA
MATLTIRNLDAAVKERLRVRAAEHGHSMEAEAREILKVAVGGAAPKTGLEMYKQIRELFEPLGGADDLVMPPHEPARKPPKLKWCWCSTPTCWR